MITNLAKRVSGDLHSISAHISSEGWRSTFLWLRSVEAPGIIQFVKYGIAGLLAVFVHFALFALLSHTLFPAHDYLADDPLPTDLKERNAILSNVVAFPVSNQVAYLLNTSFVFTTGRHSRIWEFTWFTLISFVSFAVGLLCGPLLISKGLNPWLAQASLAVTAALVNFVCRKTLVFLR